MLRKPIFIIAIHRTGSTLLKNILNANSKVAMATDEMHIYVPFKNSFGKQFKTFGNLNTERNVDRLINFIYKGKINGTFWKEYIHLGIPPQKIKRSFMKTKRSLSDLIAVMLYEYQLQQKKERAGVKFPLHFSRTKLLKKWFPDAKIILLHRDIRAVCASKLNDDATKRRKKRFGIIVHYATLIAFVIDYIWQSEFYLRNRNIFHLTDYDRLISKPKKNISDVCKYCEIEFENQMLNASGKPSSYTEILTNGFDKNRISNWKNSLNSFDRSLISILTKKSRERISRWI